MGVLYKLKPRVTLLKQFLVLDTETGKRFKDGSIQWGLRARPDAFIFGVLYGHNFQKVFYNLKDLHTELMDPKYKGYYVFMHNAEYDLGVLYGNIIQDLDPNALFNGSKFICATNGNVKFADSTNILGRVKLADIGEKIGIKKPSLGNESLFSKSLGPDEINRCVTDCRILYESLVLMFESAGNIKITQASLSMEYFRRFHQPYNIEHNENTKYFWSSYYGGRTEMFKKGKTHAKVIDINSSYPRAMRDCIFPNPAKLKKVDNVKPKKFIDYYLKYFEGCAFVYINHPKINFGLLPYKDLEKDERLLFPIGNLSGWYNFNELRFAISKGVEIINVYSCVYAPPMESPFKSYVTNLYNERLSTTDEFEKYRIKIFMNSLYGKFAQRIKEEQIYIKDINKAKETIKEYERKKLLLRIQMFSAARNDCYIIIKSVTGKNLAYSIPSFSSYITSFARVELLKKLLDLEKNRVVYCDTDSIFYEIDSENFVDSYDLGGWKIEPKIVTEIRGLKNYSYYEVAKPEVEKIRLKGVPTKAKKIDTNLFEYSNLVKTKEGLKRGIDSGVLTKRIKKISGEYTKRILLFNGETQPIEII